MGQRTRTHAQKLGDLAIFDRFGACWGNEDPGSANPVWSGSFCGDDEAFSLPREVYLLPFGGRYAQVVSI